MSSTARPSEGSNKNSKEPSDDPFTQQTSPCTRPLITPLIMAAVCAVVGISFLPLGVLALTASTAVVQVKARYDNVKDCVNGAETTDQREESLMAEGGAGINCTIEIEVSEDMEPPIFVYYELHNFYQNHRQYVKSRSNEQLMGKDSADDSLTSWMGFSSSSILENCSPMRTVPNGSDSDEEDEIDPCGLVAWTYFNDTYALYRRRVGDARFSDAIDVNEAGIAWKTDRNQRYAHYLPQNFNDDPARRGGGTINGYVDKDEHFMVWMRTATLPTFRKLWGRIDAKLQGGDVVQVNVLNRYNTYKFDGQKHIVLSTASWLGGKNNLLGILFIVLGAISCSMSMVFLWIHFDPNTRQFGDAQLLSWNCKTPH